MNQEHSPVTKFSRSWRSLIFQFLFAVAVTVFGYWATIRFPGLYLDFPLPLGENGILLQLPLFLLISLFLFARPLILLIDSHFEISEHHIRIFRGKFSIFRKIQEFAFEDLLGVQVSQSIIDRILGVGTVRVGSKTHNIEIVMGGIARPQHYADLISRRIDASRLKERQKVNSPAD